MTLSTMKSVAFTDSKQWFIQVLRLISSEIAGPRYMDGHAGGVVQQIARCQPWLYCPPVQPRPHRHHLRHRHIAVESISDTGDYKHRCRSCGDKNMRGHQIPEAPDVRRECRWRDGCLEMM